MEAGTAVVTWTLITMVVGLAASTEPRHTYGYEEGECRRAAVAFVEGMANGMEELPFVKEPQMVGPVAFCIPGPR